MKKLLKTIVSLSLCFTLIGCQSNQKENSTSNKIGLLFEMTGAVGDYGTQEVQGAKLAIKLFNEKNPESSQYSYSEYDTKSDIVQAVQLATQLASENVIGVIGAATSGATAAIFPVLSTQGKVVISPSATQNNVTFVDPQDTSSGIYENAFRVTFEDSYQGLMMAQFAYKDLGKKNVFIYTDSSNDYSLGITKSFSEKFQSLGGNVVSNEFYQSGDKEFSAVLTKVKAMDIDSFFIAGYYNEAGLIIKQAKQMGIDVTFLGGDGFESSQLSTLAGEENLNDVYFTTGYSTVNPTSQLQEFMDAYRKEYNQEPGLFSALGYDATLCLIQAHIQSVENNTDLTKELENISFSGITGSFTFDETHSPIKTVIIVELENGKQINSFTVNAE